MRVKKIVCGIILFVLAVALVTVSLLPVGAALSDIAWWKWVLGTVFFVWLIAHAVFGNKTVTHFDVFLPLCFLAIVFEEEIGTLLGIGAKVYNHWVIFAAAVLLTVGLNVIGSIDFRKKPQKAVRRTAVKTRTVNEQTETQIFDATASDTFYLCEKAGIITVRFTNLDKLAPGGVLTLDISRSSGVITVVLPENHAFVNRIDWKGRYAGPTAVSRKMPDRTFVLTGTGGAGVLEVVTEER